MARIDGKWLQLTFADLYEVNCLSTSVMLDNEDADADLVTFGDVIAGNDKRWFFTITGLPDYGDGTFWSLLWSTPPFTPLPYFFNPYGGPFATPEKPWFTGFVTVDRKPPVGGDAGMPWTFDARLTCTANPTRVTDGSP